MKTESRIPTVGAVIRPGGRNAGRRCLNGSGTSDWKWGISSPQRLCASPSVRLPSRSTPSRLPRVCPHRLLHLDMAHPLRPPPGKRVASRGKIFRSSLMEPCAVPQAARSRSRSGGKRLTGVCGWCMREVTAVVVPVSCVSSASGMGTPPKSRARSASSCTRSPLVPHRCGFAGLEPQRAPAGVYPTGTGSTCGD
jgi:hypothetical protein